MGALKSIGIGIGVVAAVGTTLYAVTRMTEAAKARATARMKAELDILSPVGSGKLALLYEVYKGRNIYHVVSKYTDAYCWANVDGEYDSQYGFGSSPVCVNEADLWLVHAVIDEVSA